ncbi:MAG: Na+/H+ antiporter [Chloroflexota bacterium]|nr:MAG: Na+/H+ antiporter [Chloroflexota bacterium]
MHRPGPLSQPKRIIIIIFVCLLAVILAACRLAPVGRLQQASLLSSAVQSTPSPTSTGDTGEEEMLLQDLENEEIILVEEVVVGLLFIAALVGIAAQRFRVPYTVGLVLMGLVLTLRTQEEIILPSNIIMALLVPPLIFEAAFHLNIDEVRRNLAPILALAIPGVILTTLMVGLVVSWGTKMALPLALVFGALVSATDPVSVVALFRRLGVPKRLQVLLEGESLLNDGTAIVVFNLVIISALFSEQSFNWVGGVIDFARVAGGGLLVGLVMGLLVSQLIGRIDDHLIETTLTSVLAFGAYLVGEVLGVSGVLAVVAAGLVNGNIGPRGMSPTTRIVVFNFWEYAAFLANSFVFLLIGIRIDLNVLFDNWEPILWAIGAVLLSRAAIVYGLSWIGRDIPVKWKHVIFWGGLRGAISLALALSLPAGLGPARDQIQVMAFGVVLFTLIVQGFTMDPLVDSLQLVQRSETQTEYERRHARAVASRTAIEYLEKMKRQGLLSEHSWQNLSPILKEHNQSLLGAVNEAMKADPLVEAEELDTARREYLRAQRSVLTSLLKDGVISDDTYSQLVSEVDAALAEPRTVWPELIMQHHDHRKPIDRLLTAVIQEQDVENAISSLTKLGIAITRLPSTGGFLGRRNATLLIGMNHGQTESAVRALSKSCRRRIEYLATPLEGSPLPFPSPTPITVGGATIFTLEIERYEEF